MILRIHALGVPLRSSCRSRLQIPTLVSRQLSLTPQFRSRSADSANVHVEEEGGKDDHAQHEVTPRITKVLVGPADEDVKFEPLVPYQVQSREKSIPGAFRKIWHGNVDIEKLEGQQTGVTDKPPEILVLRGENKTKYEIGHRYLPPLEQETIDILAAVNAERGLVSHAQVMQNIEEMRPHNDKPLTWKDFQEIENRLHDGFTQPQLASYVQKNQVPDDAKANNRGVSAKSKVSVSRWVPGISDVMRYFDSSMTRGYIAEESFTKKQTLVITLMRKCWNVQVKELVEAPGQLEIALEDEVLRLLLSGSTPLLKDISDRYLRASDSQIVVSRPRGVIRVNAKRDEAIDIAEAIVNVASRVVQYSVPSTLARYIHKEKSLLNSEALIELEKMTNTIVANDVDGNGKRQSKLARSLIMYGVDDASASQYATWTDTVNRLLLTATKPASMQTRQVACLSVAGKHSMVLQNVVAGLPWHLRSREWSRLSSETTKTVSVEDNDEPCLSFDEFTSIAKTRSSQSCSDDVWENTSNTTTAIVLGHVLHPAEEDGIARHVPAKISKDTTFLPLVQNSSHLFENDVSNDERPSTPMVRMRFIPSPLKHDMKVFDLYPEVNMRFAITQVGQQLSLREITAISDCTTTDVMIPDRALDLRFEQKVLWKMKKDVRLSAINDFLDNSQLNMLRGAVTTPPSLVLPIPKTLITGNGDADTGSASVDVEYIFAGLEFRETFSTQFAGWPLSYTTIDGGSAHGNRVEVALRSMRVVSEDMTPEEMVGLQQERTQDLVEAAFNLLDELESPERDEPVRRESPPAISTRLGNIGKDFKLFTRPIEFGIRSSYLEAQAQEEQIAARKRGRVDNAGRTLPTRARRERRGGAI